MSADEVSPAVWSLQICEQSKCELKDYKPLRAHAQNGRWWRNVVFTDYGQAVKLAIGSGRRSKTTFREVTLHSTIRAILQPASKARLRRKVSFR